MGSGDLLDHGVELLAPRLVDEVVHVLADARLVGRDDNARSWEDRRRNEDSRRKKTQEPHATTACGAPGWWLHKEGTQEGGLKPPLQKIERGR